MKFTQIPIHAWLLLILPFIATAAKNEKISPPDDFISINPNSDQEEVKTKKAAIIETTRQSNDVVELTKASRMLLRIAMFQKVKGDNEYMNTAEYCKNAIQKALINLPKEQTSDQEKSLIRDLSLLERVFFNNDKASDDHLKYLQSKEKKASE